MQKKVKKPQPITSPRTQPPKRKIKKFPSYIRDHKDVVIAIHSPDGYEGEVIITADKHGFIYGNFL